MCLLRIWNFSMEFWNDMLNWLKFGQMVLAVKIIQYKSMGILEYTIETEK